MNNLQHLDGSEITAALADFKEMLETGNAYSVAWDRDVGHSTLVTHQPRMYFSTRGYEVFVGDPHGLVPTDSNAVYLWCKDSTDPLGGRWERQTK